MTILEYQQDLIRAPVNHVPSDLSSPNLIDFEQKTDHFRACIVCKLLFNDHLSTGLCPNCDSSKKHTSYHHINLRSPPIQTHPAHYTNSDFITPLPTRPHIRVAQKFVCSHCRYLNFVNGVGNGTAVCSICRAALRTTQY